MAIDIFTADCHFEASKVAKSAEIAQYFADLAMNYEKNGYKKLHIFLDRNPTHRNKMLTLYAELMQDKEIDVVFHLMAPYSPMLNLVEYAIHLVRLKVLHHADHKLSLNEFVLKIEELCENKKIVSKEQIINILEKIDSLVPK